MIAPTRREFLATAGIVAAGCAEAVEPPPKSPLGLVLFSYGIRSAEEKGFADPVRFLEFAHERGVAGVQLPLGTRTGADARAVRTAAERFKMYVEGMVAPPKPTAADADRFASEIAAAKECGADVVRTVLLGGRRYEVFDRSEDFPAFVKRAGDAVRTAVPITRKQKVRLAIENHKDFRTDELVEFVKAIGSEWVGVCVDLGNNLALVENPAATVAALAPHAVSVHVKDIAVELADDGFRMAEVPLGKGLIDLPAAVAALRKANPSVRLNLEMLTRDPLSIPCLSDKYWATLDKVPARDLARTLALVHKSAGKESLPRVTKLSASDRLLLEDENVRSSLASAAKWPDK
jgi:3-oxoisoapionate decarboxylase